MTETSPIYGSTLAVPPVLAEDSGTEEPPFPWPPGAHSDVIGALAETWRRSVFQPTSFFRAMPAGPYGSALLYFLPLGVMAAGFRLFWSGVYATLGFSLSNYIAGFNEPSALDRLVDFLLSPLLLVIGLFLASIVLHGALKLLGAARRPLSATTRVLAFAYGVELFVIVPALGPLISAVWMLVLIVIGLREVHGTTTGRALLAVIVPFALLTILFLLVAMLAAFGMLASGVGRIR